MVSMNRFAQLGLLALPLLVACQPEFDNRFSEVDAPRVLGMQSLPAQAAPRGKVDYRILVANSDGTVDTPSVDWSYCTHAKPVNELNDVADDCFGEGDQVIPIGSGDVVTGTMPTNACRQFGPDIPQTAPGEPPARPIDADSSGGYYQPVILKIDVDGVLIQTLGETRITCGLANSTGSQLEEFTLRTKPNENPKLTQVSAPSEGDAVLEDGGATPLTVSAGSLVTLRASWPSCPEEPVCGDGMCTSGENISNCGEDCATNPVGCQGPEVYAYRDPASSSIVGRHESMRVSWFATQGSFDDDRTGQEESEYQLTDSDNRWRAPRTAQDVSMWVVLRDARGGIDWQSFRIRVE